MIEAAFVAQASRWRIVLLVLASAGFVALGLLIAGVIGSMQPPRPLIGWAGAIFFALCGIAGLFRLRQAGPVMRIDANGIWWRQWSDTIIPWNAVADTAILTIGGQTMVAVHLVDASAHPSSTLAGRMAAVNRKTFGGDLYLTVTGTDRRPAEMIDAVARFAPARVIG